MPDIYWQVTELLEYGGAKLLLSRELRRGRSLTDHPGAPVKTAVRRLSRPEAFNSLPTQRIACLPRYGWTRSPLLEAHCVTSWAQIIRSHRFLNKIYCIAVAWLKVRD